MPRDAFVKVYRWLRASSRRRIRDNRCVFGSRLAVSPRRHSGGSAVWFGITADVIERLMDYALALSSSMARVFVDRRVWIKSFWPLFSKVVGMGETHNGLYFRRL